MKTRSLTVILMAVMALTACGGATTPPTAAPTQPAQPNRHDAICLADYVARRDARCASTGRRAANSTGSREVG